MAPPNPLHTHTATPTLVIFTLLTTLPLTITITTTPAEWSTARATFHATTDPSDTLGGACGYGDLHLTGYAKATTTAVSNILFEKGQACGACYELRCVEDPRNCISGMTVIVTVTNYCSPNFGFAADGGGNCNPPNKHFVLPVQSFRKIASWKAGNVALHYRRIKCRKEGGIRFAIDGSGVFMSVLISNVAGVGDIVGVNTKGSLTGWLPMSRSWGQNWILNADLKRQPLSFEVTTSDGATRISYNVAPKSWVFGQTFEGKQFE
ncbi:expansin-A13-like [Silene latifolia]|uniref:expansin-A13-like n=1 Tax=Silene latifolia TaxID=37657 RepID=UPI003D7764C8